MANIFLEFSDLDKIKKTYFVKDIKPKNKLTKIYFSVDEMIKDIEKLYLLPINNNIFNMVNFHLIKDRDICNLIGKEKIYIPCFNYFDLGINCPFCIAKSVYNLSEIYTFNNFVVVGYDEKAYYVLYDNDYIKSLITLIETKSLPIYINLKTKAVYKSRSFFNKEIDSFDKLSIFNVYKKTIDRVINNIDDIIEILKDKI